VSVRRPAGTSASCQVEGAQGRYQAGRSVGIAIMRVEFGMAFPASHSPYLLTFLRNRLHSSLLPVLLRSFPAARPFLSSPVFRLFILLNIVFRPCSTSFPLSFLYATLELFSYYAWSLSVRFTQAKYDMHRLIPPLERNMRLDRLLRTLAENLALDGLAARGRAGGTEGLAALGMAGAGSGAGRGGDGCREEVLEEPCRADAADPAPRQRRRDSSTGQDAIIYSLGLPTDALPVWARSARPPSHSDGW